MDAHLTDFDVYVCRCCKAFPLEFTELEGNTYWAKCPTCGFISQAAYKDDAHEDRQWMMGLYRTEPDTGTSDLNQLTRIAKKIAAETQYDGPVLDLGTGYGTFLGEMLELGFSVRGIEKKTMRHLRPELIERGDYRYLPLEGFTIVTALRFMERLWDVEFFLRRVKDQFLKDEGELYVLTPLVEDALPEETAVFRNPHVSLNTWDSLQRFGTKAGYVSIERFELDPKLFGKFNLVKLTKRPAA